MPLSDVDPIEASIEIAAPPATVWEQISDLSAMPRWSPQVAKTFVRGGETRAGAKMVNLNRRGLLVWPTQSMVTEFVPEERLAFRIRDNWTVWSFTLSPTPSGGTRLIQRREAPTGISDISVRLTNALLGGVADFTEELRAGMEKTLARIKDEVERTAAA